VVDFIDREFPMTKFAGPCGSVLLVALITGFAFGAEADNDPFAPCRFLIGDWVGGGSGQPGQGSGEFTFRPELQGKVLVRRHRSEIAPTAGQPIQIHEDLMVIHPAGKGEPLKATYWDNEAHTIQYTVHPSTDGKSLTFLSDPGPAAPRFRLTYTRRSEDELGIDFAIAPPGKPDEFKTYVEGSARRKLRSQVAGPRSLPRGYVAYRAGEPITIDGKLDEKIWKAVPWTETFLDIEGDLKPVPRLATRAKMLWDDEYFYVAAQLEEPHVWGTITKHDAVIFQDNDFEIFIDPDGDNHEYYEIEINAKNTEWDLFLKKPYRDGGPAINEWEIPGLKTGVHVEGTINDPSDKDQFWSVEFAIPWKVLAEYAHRPTPPKDGDQWRINFSRVEWEHTIEDGKYRKVPGRREDNWIWSPQGYVDMHRPEFWGFVQFSTKEPGTVSFRPDPATPIRDRLIEIYHAQNRFRGKNKRWAGRIEELDLPFAADASASAGQTVEIRPTADGYEVAITFTPEGENAQTWTIRQDSRITRK
jgi:hypothetical protein